MTTQHNKNQKADEITEPFILNKFEKIIFNNFPGGIIVLNSGGVITSANKFYKDIFGINDHKSIFENDFYIDRKLETNFKELLTNGISFRKDNLNIIDQHGENKYFKIIAFPLINTDKIITGAISLFIDNTESHIFKNKLIELNSDIEEIVRQRTEELDDVNAELKNVLESKSVFMADVSHEFRTSLTIIQCSLEIISRSVNLEKENLELFNNMLTEIKRVSSTLTDLSLLNRTDLSNLKTHYKLIDLNSVISSTCKEFKVVADAKKIIVHYKESGSSVEMMAEIDDIDRLLLNLLRNAVKYNNEGGWIKVWIEQKSKGIYLYVEDNGIGIPKKEIPNIFERFYRVDKARTRKVGGSGLGLAICKHVAEIYEGTISVKSKVGKGSTFTVFFPISK